VSGMCEERKRDANNNANSCSRTAFTAFSQN
jgi:hypothetical protein